MAKKKPNNMEVTEAKPSQGSLPPRNEPAVSFDAWWAVTQRKYGLKSVMKTAIKRHFKSRGFLESKKFNEGLKDFGLKS